MARELSSGASAAILAGWGLLMHVAYRKEARRQRREAQGPGAGGVGGVARDRSLVLLERRRWVDHPLIAWLCENSAVAIVALPRLVPRLLRAQGGSRRQQVAVVWLGYMLSERLQLLMHWLLTHRVYHHIPYFHNEHSDRGVPPAHGDARRVVMEWLSASAASQLLVSLLAVFVLGRAKGGADAPGVGLLRMVWGATAGFRPLALCAKLAIVSAPLPTSPSESVKHVADSDTHSRFSLAHAATGVRCGRWWTWPSQRGTGSSIGLCCGTPPPSATRRTTSTTTRAS